MSYGPSTQSSPSALTLTMILWVCCGLGVACEDVNTGAPSGGDAVTDEGRSALLKTLSREVYAIAFTETEELMGTLESATRSWMEAPEDEERRQEAQTRWREAMVAWQRVELMQVGPAGAVGVRVGGEGLREQLYSFPIRSTCRVDQELVSEAYLEPDWAENAPFNVKGLDALEHLLFNDSLENTCPEQVKINREGEWTQVVGDVQVLNRRRSAYAHRVSLDLKAISASLSTRWSGAFARAFESGQAPFVHQQDALDQVFAGIFYLDQYIKDLKLGAPLGIIDICELERCPELIEHRSSEMSLQALIANLEGFMWVYTGAPVNQPSSASDTFGFDDLLIREGASELAAQILEQMNLALESLRSIEQTFEAQLLSDPAPLVEAHAQIAQITDLLKSQFITILNLTIPQEGAGDND